jgi:hypothetical protein
MLNNAIHVLTSHEAIEHAKAASRLGLAAALQDAVARAASNTDALVYQFATNGRNVV